MLQEDADKFLVLHELWLNDPSRGSRTVLWIQKNKNKRRRFFTQALDFQECQKTHLFQHKNLRRIENKTS